MFPRLPVSYTPAKQGRCIDTYLDHTQENLPFSFLFLPTLALFHPSPGAPGYEFNYEVMEWTVHNFNGKYDYPAVRSCR